jgi:hypothetical protein
VALELKQLNFVNNCPPVSKTKIGPPPEREKIRKYGKGSVLRPPIESPPESENHAEYADTNGIVGRSIDPGGGIKPLTADSSRILLYIHSFFIRDFLRSQGASRLRT